MTLRLQLTADSRLPIDFSEIGPEQTHGKFAAEIEKLTVFCGNRQLPLAELFAVSGDSSDGSLHLVGELASVHGIGARMAEGTIRVEGNAGRHLGAEMRGGRIEVFGDAGDWLGAEMRAGQIRVHGNGADHAAAAYPGSPRGMTGGELWIDGNVGDDLGTAMRRGLVAVGGASGDDIGARMIAGTILIGGKCGRPVGAGMRRGTIALMNPSGERHARFDATVGTTVAAPGRQWLLPTFVQGARWNPQFMRMLLVYLHRGGFAGADAWIESNYTIYHGDPLAVGKGEVLVRAC